MIKLTAPGVALCRRERRNKRRKQVKETILQYGYPSSLPLEGVLQIPTPTFLLAPLFFRCPGEMI